MAVLTIVLPRETFAALQASAASGTVRPQVTLEVTYLEDLSTAEERKANEPAELVPRSLRVNMTAEGSLQLDVGSPYEGVMTFALLRSDGGAVLTRELKVVQGKADYTLAIADVEALTNAEPAPAAATSVRSVRYAQLVPIGSVRPDFKNSEFAVLPLLAADLALLDEGGALAPFGFSKDHSSAVELDTALSASLGELAWMTVPLGVDGRFMARFELPVPPQGRPVPATAGWVWWLNGVHSAVGFVRDDLSIADRQPRIVALPALQPAPADAQPVPGAECYCGPNSTPPRVVTESELINNPQIYSEDPGAFCKPFSNPERVINEKAFAVVARVQQPDISPVPAGRLRTQHLLDFEPELPMEVSSSLRDRNIVLLQTPGRDALASALLGFNRPKRFKEPPATLAEIGQLSSGRTDLNAQRPLQWEDNIAQYQAATVALGHILEFRVRTRSNGYSLGNVASTLTLAPRQTRRIQKVEFERLERARRDESTQQADSVSDEVTRERDYNDTVSAYLSEWATGSSKSGTAAAAGGIGFAIPPIVGGVGGARVLPGAAPPSRASAIPVPASSNACATQYAGMEMHCGVFKALWSPK